MTVRSPFSLRSYDLEDPEDLRRLRKTGWYLPGLEAAWPLRGPRARDKSAPPVADRNRRANGSRPI